MSPRSKRRNAMTELNMGKYLWEESNKRKLHGKFDDRLKQTGIWRNV